MGKENTIILFSGNNKAYNTSQSLLKLLAGNPVYLGEDAGSASAMDLATLSSLYGMLLGFFHGARISETEGFSIEKYASIVADVLPGFNDFLKHEASVIQSGNFQISQSPLSISVAATERLVQTAKEAGINTDFPVYAAAALKKAQKAGYENEELAAIIKTLRHNVQKEVAYSS
jgi:3-hydroxyisobutyrate dehydrogenase-like beta-hydroxyacid dehydrogenase